MDNVVKDLYMIIDNIDTYGDMCKGNYEQFFNVVMREVKKREEYYSLFEDIVRNTTPVDTYE